MSLSANASSPIPASSAPLLQAEGVTVRFDACERPFDVVRDVSFTLHPGRTLCLVGESGCGKSMTALSLLASSPNRGASPPGASSSKAAILPNCPNPRWNACGDATSA